MKYSNISVIEVVCLYFHLLICAVCKLFTNKLCIGGNMQSGDLTVVNKGEADIVLKEFPRHVIVEFKHKKHHHSCNPHHHDSLRWAIRKNHHKKYYTLTIYWNTEDVREIVWTTFF